MSAVIEINDLHFSYAGYPPRNEPVPALRGISLTIEAGEFVALMGPVGAGKTTLCLALNGLVPQASGGEFSGSILIKGMDTRAEPVATIAQTVGLVFQDAEVQLFNASVEDEIAFGLEGLNWPPAAIEKRVDWALEAVGLQGFRQRSPRSLSGGEQKRLAIATLLAVAPKILVLDEPTEGLDPRGKRQVMDVVRRLAGDNGSTVIMATQDPETVAHLADRVILLGEGRVTLDLPLREAFMRLAGKPEHCIGVPQLALAAHELRRHACQTPFFLTVDEAYQALLPTLVQYSPRD